VNSEQDQSDVGGLARAYLRYSASLSRQEPTAELDPDWVQDVDLDEAAYDGVRGAIDGGPAARAWALVAAVIRLAPDEQLAVEAAGPLEDLVRLRGAELVTEIEAEAARDARFRWALGNIWLGTRDLPADVLARIVAASGGKIRPLDHAT
jgi:hypothetical protein